MLLVEVGVTSQRRDRRKAQIYAAAGAPEFWIVDIPKDRITVHSGPRPDGTWANVREVGIDDTLLLPGTTTTLNAVDVLRRPAGR